MSEHNPVGQKISYDAIKPILAKISIFGGLKEDQQEFLAGLLKTEHYQKGDYIFKQGGDITHIYIIRSGKVSIIVEANHVKNWVAELKTGDCFGETSVVGILPHSASAIAAEPTELMVLQRQALLNIFETDKEVFGILILNIARETCRRFHHFDQIVREKFGLTSAHRYKSIDFGKK